MCFHTQIEIASQRSVNLNPHANFKVAAELSLLVIFSTCQHNALYGSCRCLSDLAMACQDKQGERNVLRALPAAHLKQQAML